jgi:uncharacterized protein (DUF3084 family)
MSDFPSWAIPLAVNVTVALTMLRVLSVQLGDIKKELHDLSKEFRNTREDVAALQKGDGYQQAQIEKLEERVTHLSEYWQRRAEK